MGSEPALTFSLYVRGAHPERPRLELALSLPNGVCTLLGPSGSGKSSCLLALAGVLRPERGQIVLAGRTLYDSERAIDLPTRVRKVALVFQSLALFPHMSALENVMFGLPRALAGEARVARARSWLARMRVEPLADRRPATLSGGEAQRIALARALASAPALLLLDEPFSALDRTLRRELAEQVEEVVRELNIPALLVTHDEADGVLDPTQVVHLREGRRA